MNSRGYRGAARWIVGAGNSREDRPIHLIHGHPMKTALMFLVSMLAVACPSGHANPQDDLVAGMRLSAKQASDLEAAVAADPDDFAAHAKLLGYYSMTRFNSTEAKESSRKA